jgi:hypothetical protein
MSEPYGRHLPIFPCLDYAPLTDARIERAAERLVDRADALFMSGDATLDQYDAWFKRLNEWIDEQYAAV